MTFDKLHDGIDCDCIKNAKDDFQNEYVRRLRKKELSEKDFLTHWERGIGKDEIECEVICSYKGISVNQINETSEQLIIEKYKTTFKINPKRGGYFLKFRIKENGGKIKHAPSKKDNTHYNFYKSDEFDI